MSWMTDALLLLFSRCARLDDEVLNVSVGLLLDSQAAFYGRKLYSCTIAQSPPAPCASSQRPVDSPPTSFRGSNSNAYVAAAIRKRKSAHPSDPREDLLLCAPPEILAPHPICFTFKFEACERDAIRRPFTSTIKPAPPLTLMTLLLRSQKVWFSAVVIKFGVDGFVFPRRYRHYVRRAILLRLVVSSASAIFGCIPRFVFSLATAKEKTGLDSSAPLWLSMDLLVVPFFLFFFFFFPSFLLSYASRVRGYGLLTWLDSGYISLQ